MTRVGATGGASKTRVTAIYFTFCTKNSFHSARHLLFQSFLYQSDKAIRADNFNARAEGQHTDNDLRFIGCVIFQMKQILIIANTLRLLFKVRKVEHYTLERIPLVIYLQGKLSYLHCFRLFVPPTCACVQLTVYNSAEV